MTDNIIVLAERRPREPEDMRPMCEIAVLANGDVTVFLGDDIETPEQFNWLLAKLAGATGAVFDAKVEQTSHL